MSVSNLFSRESGPRGAAVLAWTRASANHLKPDKTNPEQTNQLESKWEHFTVGDSSSWGKEGGSGGRREGYLKC